MAFHTVVVVFAIGGGVVVGVVVAIGGGVAVVGGLERGGGGVVVMGGFSFSSFCFAGTSLETGEVKNT